MSCGTLPHTATHHNTLPHTATHHNTPHHIIIHCITLHHTASHCITLYHTAPHRTTLHHTHDFSDGNGSDPIDRFDVTVTNPHQMMSLSRTQIKSHRMYRRPFTSTASRHVTDVSRVTSSMWMSRVTSRMWMSRVTHDK